MASSLEFERFVGLAGLELGGSCPAPERRQANTLRADAIGTAS